MQRLTCIVCPIGCALEVKDSLSVTGNKCLRGETYALEEIRSPKRVVTATCRIENNKSSTLINSVPPCNEPFGSMGVNLIPRLPVKTSSPCPKEKIPYLLQDIYKIKVSLPVKLGDVIIENWNGKGINIVATRSIG